jgi:hypothetical protein
MAYTAQDAAEFVRSESSALQKLASEHSREAMWSLDDARSVFLRMEDQQDAKLLALRESRLDWWLRHAADQQRESAELYARARKLLSIEA